MFAYCRNSPIYRVDISGTEDAIAYNDGELLSNDDLEERAKGGSKKTSSGSSTTAKNSGGRHGGSAHRNTVTKMRNFFEKLGYKVSSKESRVYVDDSGSYRYPDLTIYDGNDTIRYIQVGRQNANGSPCAREQRAMNDLAKTGIEIWFIPYN